MSNVYNTQRESHFWGAKQRALDKKNAEENRLANSPMAKANRIMIQLESSPEIMSIVENKLRAKKLKKITDSIDINRK